MVGKATYLQLVVGKTTMDGFVDSRERDIFFPVFKDGTDTRRLLFDITKYV